MEEIIQLFRKLKKSKSHQNGLDLDLASPNTSSDDVLSSSAADLQKTKFMLKRPRLTSSPTERKIQQHKSKQSKVKTISEEKKVDGDARPGSPFADEDDLFADRDDGVYMQSSSTTSSSPAASERLHQPSLQKRPNLHENRPASCTFGSQNGSEISDFKHHHHRLFQPRTTFQTVSQSRGGCGGGRHILLQHIIWQRCKEL